MKGWQKTLKSDSIPWLLEPENPSVRYWTLRDVLDRPESDAELRQARAAIARQPLVKEIFSRQHPDGHWGDDETKPYTAEGAVTALALLSMLGVPADKRTQAGCESLLRFCQAANGGFSLTRTIPSAVFPCTTGEHLPFLVHFGLGADPRVRAAFLFVIEDMSTLKPLDCGRYQHRDCLWGAIAALNGLAALPADMHSPRAKAVVRKLADALLDAHYDFAAEHKRWLSFGVPRVWDLLSALKALAANGYAKDPRFKVLLKRLLDLQDAHGRWLCGSVSKTWPLEKRGQPSKWVTLDALRVLKQAG